MGLTYETRNLLVVSLLLLLLSDICKYRGINLIEWITKQGIWLRWLIYFSGIFGRCLHFSCREWHIWKY